MRNPVHWQIMLDENEWDAETGLDELLQAQPLPPPAHAAARPVNWRLLTTLAGLCLATVLGVALFLYQQALAGVALIEAELGAVVELERHAVEVDDQALLASLSDRQGWEARSRQSFALPTGEESPSIAVTIENVELRDGSALVEVLVQDSRLPLAWREARFYRETPTGWLRTAPQPVFWGSRQSLQSQYFLFHFHFADRLAVEEAAPRLDANYARIRALLALPVEEGQTPLVVDVRVLDLPQERRAEVYADGTFVAWSPLLPARPEGLSQADMLVESISGALITQSVQEMRTSLPRGWPLSYTASRLWLTWEVDSHLTLSQSLRWNLWRTDMRRIQEKGIPSTAGESATSPEDYLEMCQTLAALNLLPYYLGIRENCKGEPPQLAPEDGLTGWGEGRLTVAVGSEPFEEQNRQTETPGNESLRFTNWPVDQALFFHYLTVRYGAGAMPHLLETSRTHYSWPALILAAFDVPFNEFNSDWQQYLQATLAQELPVSAPSSPHPPSESPR